MKISSRLVTARLLAALAMATIGVPVVQAGQSTCHVRNVTQETRGPSVRAMVKAAVDSDRLTVRGTCRARFVVVRADLVIRGFGEQRAVLDARGDGRVLRVKPHAIVTLRYLAITGGRAPEYPGNGGGILNSGALTLVDSVVRGNTAAFGGGIWSRGTLALADSVVRDNSAEDNGGGILTRGDVTLSDTVVRRNAAGGIGGGIFNHEDQDPVGIITLYGGSSVSGNTPDDCVGTDAC